MTTYNTGNPIGSKDPRDLYDNAENLDEAVNTRQAESWDDRLGVARKTWWGMEQDFQDFLINSGYENIGDYGPGLEITARNQIFWRDGELYRAGASLELPYTTTGDWGAEEGLFVAVGDQALRQELSSSNVGASLISRGVVSVSDYSELISLPQSMVREDLRYLVGATQMRWTGSSFEAVGDIWVESFGVSDNNGDNSDAYDRVIDFAPDGSVLRWGANKRYTGSFHSIGKSFVCDLQGSTLVPPNGKYALFMESESVVHNVVESVLLAGTTQFTLTEEVLINDGALIILWDGATRPAGPSVNRELVQVKSSEISSGQTVIYIEDRVWAHKGFSSITAEVFNEPLRDPKIINGFSDNPHLSQLPSFRITGAIDPAQERLETKSSLDSSFLMHACLRPKQEGLRCLDPDDVSSGKGYGTVLVSCKDSRSVGLYGRKTRHTYDASSTYGLNIVEDVVTDEAIGTPVVFCHNGFGGSFSIRKIRYSTSEYGIYGVASLSQGYGNALRENHPTGIIHIQSVEGFHFGSPDLGNHVAVMIQTDTRKLTIDDIDLAFSIKEPTTSDSGSRSLVNVQGSSHLVKITNVRGEYCGRFIVLQAQGDFVGRALIDGVDFIGSHGAGVIGAYDVDIRNVRYSGRVSGDSLFQIQAVGELRPTRFYYGEGNYALSSVQERSPAVVIGSDIELRGSISKGSVLSSDSVSVTEGSSITALQLYTRSNFLRLNSPFGFGSINVSLPKPILFAGDECFIHVLPSRDAVHFTGDYANDFTVSSGDVARIVSVGGLWTLKG